MEVGGRGKGRSEGGAGSTGVKGGWEGLGDLAWEAG